MMRRIVTFALVLHLTAPSGALAQATRLAALNDAEVSGRFVASYHPFATALASLKALGFALYLAPRIDFELL